MTSQISHTFSCTAFPCTELHNAGRYELRQPKRINQVGQSRRRFAALILCATFLLSGVSPVEAQSRPKIGEVNDRLIRVENILDQSLLDLLQQIQRLEQEMRVLRGELEGQTNEISQLEKRLEANSADYQRQLSDLQQQLDAAPRQDLSGESGGDGSSSSGSGEILEVLDPGDETAAAREAVASDADATAANATEAETEAYRSAYDLLESDRFDEAIAAFEDFLSTFPISPYADNALYWQGEAMYAKRSFEDAIVNFNVLIESFKTSPKVPDAKLKIGYALYEQSRFKDARAILESVTSDYSGRAAAVLAQKRLDEMDQRGL